MIHCRTRQHEEVAGTELSTCRQITGPVTVHSRVRLIPPSSSRAVRSKHSACIGNLLSGPLRVRSRCSWCPMVSSEGENRKTVAWPMVYLPACPPAGQPACLNRSWRVYSRPFTLSFVVGLWRFLSTLRTRPHTCPCLLPDLVWPLTVHSTLTLAFAFAFAFAFALPLLLSAPVCLPSPRPDLSLCLHPCLYLSLCLHLRLCLGLHFCLYLCL